MRTSRIFVALLSVTLLASCSTIITDVNYDYDKGVDFTNLRTYDWESLQPSSREAELTMKRIKYEVDAQLAAKGFMAAKSNPDFMIALQGHRQTKTDHFKNSGDTFTYEEGTLVLDFLAGKTREPIWRGTATGILDPSPSPEERDKNINRAVTRMLKHFPPTP